MNLRRVSFSSLFDCCVVWAAVTFYWPVAAYCVWNFTFQEVFLERWLSSCALSDLKCERARQKKKNNKITFQQMTDPTVSKLQPNFNVIPFFLCNSFEVIDLSSSDVKLQSLFNLFPFFVSNFTVLAIWCCNRWVCWRSIQRCQWPSEWIMDGWRPTGALFTIARCGLLPVRLTISPFLCKAVRYSYNVSHYTFDP